VAPPVPAAGLGARIRCGSSSASAPAKTARRRCAADSVLEALAVAEIDDGVAAIMAFDTPVNLTPITGMLNLQPRRMFDGGVNGGA
jgi:hypothetical protein